MESSLQAGTLRGKWRRVTRRRPCPVCGKPDWCLYTGDDDAPTAAICQRIESPKQCGAGGWLHKLRDDDAWRPSRRMVHVPVDMTTGGIDFGRLAARYAAAVRSEALAALAAELGLTAGSLTRLGIGWAPEHRAWSFPMTNAAGRAVGIRLRLPNGRKLAVRGGKEGLFVPGGLSEELRTTGRLLVCEGPTDTAAMLDLGFPAVGRPSCTGGVRLLVDLVRRLGLGELVVIADADPPGQRGAATLAAALVLYAPVKIITPPARIKDARAWKRAGATAADLLAAIAAAPVGRLRITSRRTGSSRNGQRTR